MNGDPLIEAINDLARIMIACNLSGSKSDAVRRLHSAGVKQARIAALLDMETKDVTSLISKLRKSNEKRKGQTRA